jgi:Leucine-rich repeat (LRR) protein
MSISDHCLDAVPFEPETLRLASRRNHPVAGWRWLTPTVMTLVTALLAAASYAAETPVFKDRNLEKAVRKFVFEKRDSDKPLVESDLVDLSTVQAGGMGITDLAGLEKCPNLASLDLSQNKILDLRPLQTLVKLEYLNLATNQVSDLAPLAGIASLQYIELSHNRVKELRPLATLTNLASLYLGNNRIDDLAPLLKLPRLT